VTNRVPRRRLINTHTQLSTPQQKAADAALRALLASEGEDAVTRVYANAVADARLERFYAETERFVGGPIELDDREHSHLHRLGEDSGRCSQDCDVYRVIGRLGDHQKRWRCGEKFVLITTDDYDLRWEDLQRLVDYCRDHGYEAVASARNSYYFPAAAIQVRVAPAGTQQAMWDRELPSPWPASAPDAPRPSER